MFFFFFFSTEKACVWTKNIDTKQKIKNEKKKKREVVSCVINANQ